MAEQKLKDFTTREVYAAILDGKMDAKSSSGQTVLEKVQQLADAIDKRNAKNRENPKKKVSVDNTKEKAEIMAFLSTKDESVLAKEIAEACEMRVPKATAVIRQLVKEGAVQRLDLGRNMPLEYKKA